MKRPTRERCTIIVKPSAAHYQHIEPYRCHRPPKDERMLCGTHLWARAKRARAHVAAGEELQARHQS